MRILLYRWKAYSDYFLESNLRQLGHTVTVWEDDGLIRGLEEAVDCLQRELDKGYELVFSYNYFAGVARAGYLTGVPYVAWSQDAPLLSLYDQSAAFDTNRFYCFDSEQYESLLQRGLPHVFYRPLGVDIEAMEAVADDTSAEERERYTADISFVGSLYSGKSIYSEIYPGLAPYVQGYLSAFLQTQLMVPAVRFSQMNIEAECKTRLKGQLNFSDAENYTLQYDQLVDNLVDREVTVLEREAMLRACADMSGFKLYTNSDEINVPGIRNCGAVDYYTEMPKVFRHSRVNLNVSLRSIRRGIPLRVLDIIAAGGFVLSNAQPDLFLYFEEGKSIVTFQDWQDMRAKAEYYLEHEEERLSIIEAGKKVLWEHFDMFSVCLPKILNLALK